MFLSTERVVLREIKATDLAHFLQLDSDPEVMRFISQGRASAPNEIESAFGRIQKIYLKHQGKFGCWVAIERETGEFLGWFLFRPAHADPDNTSRIEIGYRLLRRHWGKGWATEVSKVLIQYGFETLQIKEIFAIAVSENLGSRSVMKKLGMELVREFGSQDFTDEYETIVEYSISKETYLQNAILQR